MTWQLNCVSEKSKKAKTENIEMGTRKRKE
nr:MAG TPA: hypothetical protein [Caudoviricetes sp.]